MQEEMRNEPVRLLAPEPVEPLPAPDASAERVLEGVGAGDNLVVLGAPGTGKSSIALRLLVDAVRQGRHALLLSPTRARADLLRGRAAHLLEGEGGGVVRVRTPAGFAFSVLSTSLTARADPLPSPVLLAGAEEDAALAALIRPDQWPGLPPEAVTSRAFRSELRNLLARAGELGVDADALADLGRALDIPLWGPASALLRTWDAQGRPSASRRGETRRMDTARLQDRAVEALRDWDTDGVLEARPVPDLVIVDDYQDCTAATARLLAALNRPTPEGRRAQVVVLGDPDVAVETFRGGTPSLLVEAEDGSGLAARRLHLETCYRGGTALAAVWGDQADRLPVTGTTVHRRPRPGVASASDDQLQPPSGVLPLVATSQAQETAHVARVLRSERVHHATGWGQMAVIVRSAGQAQVVARELRRRGVPLASSTPAVLLRAEPAAVALLAVARAALEGRLGGSQALPERPSTLDLLSSPLVGLSVLDLRRLRRRLRVDRPAEKTPDENLLGVLSSPDAAKALAGALSREPLAQQAEQLVRAASVIAAVRQVVGTARGEAGEGTTTEPASDPARSRVDVEELLWAAWQASGRAEEWRAAALAPGARASYSEALLAEAAERDLDVVTALFKRAEVWAERHPGEDASVFLAELAEEVLPSDSVAPQGVRPQGVSVLTPASAAGREWQVVAVMGLGRDAWPDLRLRDSLTCSGTLVEAVTGRLPLGPDGVSRRGEDPSAARAQVRADERRMLLSALTRATRRLVVTATLDEENAPSPFLTEVARVAGTLLQEDGKVLTAPDVGDLTLRGLVGELRHAAVQGRMDEAGPQERERVAQAEAVLASLAQAKVSGASPQDWAGLSVPTSTDPLVPPGQVVHVSPSTVEGVLACPLKWFLGRHGGGGASSGAQNLGTLVHEIAETAQREGLRGEDLRDLLEQRLPELSYPDTWLGSLDTEHARTLVERLDSYLTGVPGRVAVEKSVGIDLLLPLPPEEKAEAEESGPGRTAASTLADRSGQVGASSSPETIAVHVGGRIDRIEYLDPSGPADPSQAGGSESATDGADDDRLPPGEGARIRVMDLKTGSRKPDGVERHAQLATYRLALQSHGYEVVGAGLVMLGASPKTDGITRVYPEGAALAPSPDPETGEDWATQMVAAAARDARGSYLEARTGVHCTYCPVQTSCPAVIEGKRVVA